MGKVGKGILGGWKNRVGTVIGYNWKTIECMRSMPSFVHNPQTEAQQQQRLKFRAATQFARAFGGATLSFWLRPYEVKKSGWNYFIQYLLKNAIGGSYPNYTITYANIEPGANDIMPTCSATVASREVTITYTMSDTEEATTLYNVAPNLIVFNADKNEVFAQLDSLPDYDTSSGSVTSDTLPASWAGDTIEVFFFYLNADNTRLYKTQFLGEFTA